MRARNDRIGGSPVVWIASGLLISVGGSAAPGWGQVLASPPDSIAAHVVEHFDTTRYFPRNVMAVAFVAGVPAGVKDSILTAAGGSVVGGIPIEGGAYDGFYVVELPDPDSDRLGPVGRFSIDRDRDIVPLAFNLTHELVWGWRLRGEGDVELNVLEIEGRERWIRGNRPETVAPWSPVRVPLRVDSVVGTVGGGRIWHTGGDAVGGYPSWARIETATEGHILAIEVPRETERRTTLFRANMRARFLPLSVGPVGSVPEGDVWADSSGFRAERGVSSLEGSMARTLTSQGPVEVGPGPVRIRYREETSISLVERWSEREYEYRPTDTSRVELRAEGRLIGSVTVDPASGRVIARDDRVELSGSIVKALPDGRELEAPVRYEGEWVGIRYDPVSFAVRYQERVEERQRTGRSIIGEPVNDIERRLRAGDALLRDSLLARWQETSDAAERAEIRAALGWYRNDPGIHRDLLLATGDTAAWVGEVAAQADARLVGPLGVDDLRVLLPIIDDGDRAWALGIGGGEGPYSTRFGVWSRLMGGIATFPPAVTTDTTQWALTLEAYEELAEWRDDAREPRLRDLATFAWYVLDPAARYVAIEARAAADDATYMTQEAIRVAHGVSPGYPNRVMIPGRGAPLELWREYSRGFVDPALIDLHEATFPARDVRGEIVERAEVGSPEEQAFFASLGRGLGLIDLLPPEDVLAGLTSDDPEVVAASRIELQRLFASATPAPDSIAGPLADALLAQLLDQELSWRYWDDPARRVSHQTWFVNRGEVDLFFVDSDARPPISPEWLERIAVLSEEEWLEREHGLEGGKRLTLEVIKQVGPIVSVSFRYRHIEPRRPVEAGRGHAAWMTVYLARRDGAWWVVSGGGYGIT